MRMSLALVTILVGSGCECGAPKPHPEDGGTGTVAVPAVKQVISGAGQMRAGSLTLDGQLGGAISPAPAAPVQPVNALQP